MTNKKMGNDHYYSEDTRLALLEHTISDINKTLERFEKRFDRMDEKFDKLDAKFDKKIDGQFKWIIGILTAVAINIITVFLQYKFK